MSILYLLATIGLCFSSYDSTVVFINGLYITVVFTIFSIGTYESFMCLIGKYGE